jgi:hypothetical protein
VNRRLVETACAEDVRALAFLRQTPIYLGAPTPLGLVCIVGRIDLYGIMRELADWREYREFCVKL